MNCKIYIVILLESLAFGVFSQEVQDVVQNGNRNSSDSTNNKQRSITEDVWLNSLLKDINTPLQNIQSNFNDTQGSSIFALSDVVEFSSTNINKKETNSKEASSTNKMTSKISSGNDQNQVHIFNVLDKKQHPKVVHTKKGNRKTTIENTTDFLFFQDFPNDNFINSKILSKMTLSNNLNQHNAMNVLEKKQHSKNNVHKNIENRLITTVRKPTGHLVLHETRKDKTIQSNLQTSNKDNVISHELNARNSLKTSGFDQVLPENPSSEINTYDLYLQLENIIKRLLNSNSNPSSSLRSSRNSLFGGRSRDLYPWHITANDYLKENSHSNVPLPVPETEPHPEPFFQSNTDINAGSHSRGIDGHDAVDSFLNVNLQSNIPHPEPEVEPHSEPFFLSNAGGIVRTKSGRFEGRNVFNSFIKMNSHSNIPHPEPEIEPQPEPFLLSNTNSQVFSLLRKFLFDSKRSEERENKRSKFPRRLRNRSLKGKRHFHFDD